MLNKLKEKIPILIILFTLLFLFYSGYQIYKSYEIEKESKRLTELAQEMANIKMNNITTRRVVDVEKLKKELNKNIVGWIFIKGTNIDEPIVYYPNNDYYLYRDLKDNYNDFGSIFLDENNNIDFKDTVSYVFGHNTFNNTKFSQLNKFNDKDFLSNNKEISIFTKDKELVYEIIGTTYVNPITTLYPKNKFIQDDMKYIKYELVTNNINSESIKDNDKLLMLVTCLSYTNSDYRQIVVAKLIKEINL